MKEKISTYSEFLKEKLFLLNPHLRSTLLNVREKIFKLEDLRILTYGNQGSYGTDTTYELEEFAKVQKRNRHKIKEAIKYSSGACR